MGNSYTDTTIFVFGNSLFSNFYNIAIGYVNTPKYFSSLYWSYKVSERPLKFAKIGRKSRDTVPLKIQLGPALAAHNAVSWASVDYVGGWVCSYRTYEYYDLNMCWVGLVAIE